VTDGRLTDSEDITITVNNVFQPDINTYGFIKLLDMIIIGQDWTG